MNLLRTSELERSWMSSLTILGEEEIRRLWTSIGIGITDYEGGKGGRTIACQVEDTSLSQEAPDADHSKVPNSNWCPWTVHCGSDAKVSHEFVSEY